MDEHLFSQERKPEQPAPHVTEVATRLKLAEERYVNLQKRNQLMEESLLSFEREMKSELKVATQQLNDLRRHIVDINQKVDAIEGELQAVVPRHEFQVLERYIDLWQPMRFVTVDEAKRLAGRVKNG